MLRNRNKFFRFQFLLIILAIFPLMDAHATLPAGPSLPGFLTVKLSNPNIKLKYPPSNRFVPDPPPYLTMKIGKKRVVQIAGEIEAPLFPMKNVRYAVHLSPGLEFKNYTGKIDVIDGYSQILGNIPYMEAGKPVKIAIEVVAREKVVNGNIDLVVTTEFPYEKLLGFIKKNPNLNYGPFSLEQIEEEIKTKKDIPTYHMERIVINDDYKH